MDGGGIVFKTKEIVSSTPGFFWISFEVREACPIFGRFSSIFRARSPIYTKVSIFFSPFVYFRLYFCFVDVISVRSVDWSAVEVPRSIIVGKKLLLIVDIPADVSHHLVLFLKILDQVFDWLSFVICFWKLLFICGWLN